MNEIREIIEREKKKARQKADPIVIIYNDGRISEAMDAHWTVVTFNRHVMGLAVKRLKHWKGSVDCVSTLSADNHFFQFAFTSAHK